MSEKRDGLEVLTGELAETAHAIVDRYPHKRSAILPLLFLVQSAEGYVTEAGMRDVAILLDLTPAEVLAAGSFYTMLKKRPQGDYLISVCRNISCTHLGARRVIAAAEKRLDIGVGETTPDGRFTLEAAECLATCDGAPAIQINYEDFYGVTPQVVTELIDELSAGNGISSVRGESVKTIKEIARETAMAGTHLPDIEAEPRTVGGESPPPDMAPGFRPKERGRLGDHGVHSRPGDPDRPGSDRLDHGVPSRPGDPGRPGGDRLGDREEEDGGGDA